MHSFIIEVNSLYVVDKQVIGLYFFGLFVSLLLGSRYGMPFASHCKVSSGFFIVCDSVLVTTLCVDVKIFSQKSGTLSSLGDFHFCDIFSENCTSFN